MAYMRFGFAGPGDDLPIDQWMDDQNDYVARRDSLDAAGREAWDQSTKTGENLQANRSTDVVTLGGSNLDPEDNGTAAAATETMRTGANPFMRPSDSGDPTARVPRYVKAHAGDSITRLVGSSDPNAIGAFARMNGMDGRSSTIYAGRVYALPGPDDFAARGDAQLGDSLLRNDNSRLAALHASNPANDQFGARLNAGLNVWTGRDPYDAPFSPTSPLPSPQPSWVDRSVPLKALAGTGAYIAGIPYGVMRGSVHLGQDIGNAVDFGLRLVDARDAENHPLDEPARDVVRDFGRHVGGYAQSVAADPRIAMRDAGNLLQKANVSLNPFATPMASTLSGEISRDLGIGANTGEFGLQVGTALEGGAEVAALRAAKPLTQAEKASKLISEGYDATTAAHLAGDYVGAGSHYAPRRTRIPEQLFGLPLPDGIAGQAPPKWFMNGPLNVSKPTGMSRDEFYRYHYAVDPHFHGAKLPAGMRGLNGRRGWSGAEAGLKKYGPVGRAWNGAPKALKESVGGSVAGTGLTAFGLNSDDDAE